MAAETFCPATRVSRYTLSEGSAVEFTAHNIEFADGERTMPEVDWLIAESPWLRSALRSLRVAFGGNVVGKSIIDLGCLEGGYALEFARAGMESLGLEVRQSNFDNCLITKRKAGLSNPDFVKDDYWNLGNYGPFDAIFCSGLLYHLDQPRKFLKLLGDNARRVLILNTHYASEVSIGKFNLSPVVVNEGLSGRWFAEHDADSAAEREALKWVAWANKRSFWLIKPAIVQGLHDSRFDVICEQYDWITNDDPLPKMISDEFISFQRAMFVGIKSYA
jgi:SAM-dependent methyltransferase